MKSRSLVSILSLFVATAPLLGCATDRRTNMRVASRLAADPQVRGLEVDNDTRGGVVTLRGTVETEEQKRAAEEVAMRTEGVDRVDNQLVVQRENFREATGKFGSDAWIRTKVGSKLIADPDVGRFSIDVDVEDGVVILSGRVADESAKLEAEQLARNTEGVRRVQNDLTVARVYKEAQAQQQGQQ